MRLTWKFFLQSLSLFLFLCVIYLPMINHPPTIPKSQIITNQTKVANEKVDQTSLRQDIEVKEHGEVKFLAPEPMMK